MAANEDRIVNLEEKVMYLERDVSDLDEVVRSMHDRIDRLVTELGAARGELQAMLAKLDDAGPTTNADLENERPPHY